MKYAGRPGELLDSAGAEIGDLVEDMAASMLASTLGIEFDPEEAYDTRRALYRMSGRIVRTRAVVQTVEGDKRGQWTSAVAAAVFIMDDVRGNGGR